MRQSRTVRRGFTLVELLVVIGIIALLIGILLPALSRAREQANKVACSSNMRQLVMGFMAYLTDNKDHFPRPASSVTGEDWIYWQAGRNLDDSRIVPYMGGTFVAKVFRCPSDSEVEQHINGASGFKYSYTVNETMARHPNALAGVADPTYPAIIHGKNPGKDAADVPYDAANPNTPSTLKSAQISHSADKIMIADESSTTIDDGCWAPQNYIATGSALNTISIRHDKHNESKTDVNAGRGNVAFADGHVDFIPRADAMDPRHWDATWDWGP